MPGNFFAGGPWIFTKDQPASSIFGQAPTFIRGPPVFPASALFAPVPVMSGFSMIARFQPLYRLIFPNFC